MNDPGRYAESQRDGIDIVVQRVRVQAMEDCPPNVAWAPWMDRCVAETVTRLWQQPIHTYLPLLALREVRCCIRAGTCDCGEC